MNLAEKAVFDFYNGFLDNRKIFLKYSSRFKGLNANVLYTNKEITFNLSKEWANFSEEIRVGLIQSLAMKVFKKESGSLELDLYHKFVSNLPKYAKIDKNDPLLEESFKRINFKYFNNDLTRPNLVWGLDAFTKLGHYEHQSDTVLISSIFKDNLELLDYIMFHELLHKKHGIMRGKTGRIIHHSRTFRLEEKSYEDENVEKKLKVFVRKKRFKNWLGF